jgi:hypothetical protein
VPATSTTSRARAARWPADRIVRWIVRVLWVALPFTAGPTLADALAGASRPVQLVATAGLWAGWAAGTIATAVALPVSLTTLRVVGPAAVAAVVIAAIGGHGSPLAIGWAAVAMAWLFSPTFGAACVNGPAYPNERRFLLRAPGALLAGPLVLVWALLVAGLSAGPLLLAARRWVVGGLLVVVGIPVALLLLRALHNLSSRWAVFVPAGLVVHDPITLVDPVLLRRQSITRLGPARARAAARTGTVDLTQRAPGLALSVDLDEEVQLSLVRPGRRLGDSATATRLVITPTRPGAVVEEAKSRRFRVG